MKQYNFVDLSGQRFGRLVVLHRVENKWSPSGQGHTQYLCQCDCGNTTITQAQLLRKGGTVSCGCYKNETAMKRVHKNLEGQRFGKLLVIARGDVYISPKGKHKSRWICKCDCGNVTNVLQTSLLRGMSISCGCQKESRLASELKNYLEKNCSAISEYKIIQHPTNHRWMPYDIYIPGGIFIEIHGLQHYQDVEYFYKNQENGFENRRYIDNLKKQFAEQNGIYIEIDLRKIKTLESAIQYIKKQI